MDARTILAAVLAACVLAGCSQGQDDPVERRPQQAGQPLDPVRTAGQLGAARIAALTGDQAAFQRSANEFSEDLRRSMKIPDSTRPIDPEAARSVTRAMPGVLSATWIDRSNFLVRVAGADLRGEKTINDLCYRLEALGDTLAVVVHLQNGTTSSYDEVDTLSRNCQLRPGDHAFMQRARQMDVLDPAIRAEHRARVNSIRDDGSQTRTVGDQAALDAIPEM